MRKTMRICCSSTSTRLTSSLSERTKQRLRQSLQRRPPITVEADATRRSTIADRTPSVMMRCLGYKHAVVLALRPEYGMEALQIESQTDQTPLASRRQFPAQGELAKAQHLLDDADHRFNRAFACAVDGFA